MAVSLQYFCEKSFMPTCALANLDFRDTGTFCEAFEWSGQGITLHDPIAGLVGLIAAITGFGQAFRLLSERREEAIGVGNKEYGVTYLMFGITMLLSTIMRCLMYDSFGSGANVIGVFQATLVSATCLCLLYCGLMDLGLLPPNYRIGHVVVLVGFRGLMLTYFLADAASSGDTLYRLHIMGSTFLVGMFAALEIIACARIGAHMAFLWLMGAAGSISVAVLCFWILNDPICEEITDWISGSFFFFLFADGAMICVTRFHSHLKDTEADTTGEDLTLPCFI